MQKPFIGGATDLVSTAGNWLRGAVASLATVLGCSHGATTQVPEVLQQEGGGNMDTTPRSLRAAMLLGRRGSDGTSALTAAQLAAVAGMRGTAELLEAGADALSSVAVTELESAAAALDGASGSQDGAGVVVVVEKQVADGSSSGDNSSDSSSSSSDMDAENLPPPHPDEHAIAAMLRRASAAQTSANGLHAAASDLLHRAADKAVAASLSAAGVALNDGRLSPVLPRRSYGPSLAGAIIGTVTATAASPGSRFGDSLRFMGLSADAASAGAEFYDELGDTSSVYVYTYDGSGAEEYPGYAYGEEDGAVFDGEAAAAQAAADEADEQDAVQLLTRMLRGDDSGVDDPRTVEDGMALHHPISVRHSAATEALLDLLHPAASELLGGSTAGIADA